MVTNILKKYFLKTYVLCMLQLCAEILLSATRGNSVFLLPNLLTILVLEFIWHFFNDSFSGFMVSRNSAVIHF